MAITPRLLEYYRKQIAPELQKTMNYPSVMAVPRLKKIIISMGIGQGGHDIKILEKAMEELAMITGQKPVVRRAKKAISNFKIRAGLPIGCMVTLRRAIMYEFFDRFISVALPRIRDFKGFPESSFDGRGSYSMGLTEQSIFPEIEIDKVLRTQGMNITIVTSARTDKEALALLKSFGFPFRSQ